MTLRGRLFLSALILSIATTAVLAFVVRSSWQNAEEDRFRDEFARALQDIETNLGERAREIQGRLQPLCAHDPLVDSALIGLQGGTLPARLLSIRTRVPELARSLSLDELILVSHRGQVLGGESQHSALEASELADLVEQRSQSPELRVDGELAFEAACVKREAGVWVGLLAATHLEPALVAAGNDHDLSLSLLVGDRSSGAPSKKSSEVHVEQQPLGFLPGAMLRAERSRIPLRASLKDLDVQVLTASGATLLVAFLLALLLSRGLSRPVVRFAERTRQAVQGTVQQLPISGGPELEQAARAFNATLADLAALRERLRATERIAARREVARQVAHEIKNPLSPIRTSIETLRKMKERGLPEFESYFDETTKTVLSEVARISRLVSHFSEYARLPSPSPADFVLETRVRQIVELHRSLGAKVSFETDGENTVHADEEQVTQVVTNLVKNAIEATEGSPAPWVGVFVAEETGSEGRVLLVTVEDNGPGLSAADASRVFEPYVSSKEGGSGLGLPISHRIAVEHGGDLTYTTRPEGGARFVFSLPVHGPPHLADPAG